MALYDVVVTTTQVLRARVELDDSDPHSSRTMTELALRQADAGEASWETTLTETDWTRAPSAGHTTEP